MLATAPTPTPGRPLLIRNGLVVTAERRYQADVRVAGGKIAEIGVGLGRANAAIEEIDATGCYILPGGIDPHVHLTLPAPYSWRGGRFADDFASGSRAAVAGGITTVGNITFPTPGESILEAVRRETELAGAQSLADFMLHPVVGTPSRLGLLLGFAGVTQRRDYREAIGDVPRLVAAGQPSLKIFMNFEEFERNFEGFLAVLRAAGDAGALTMLHCEHLPTIEEAIERLRADNRASLRHFAESRPVLAEERAVRRAVAMCEETGAPIYLVHLSSERALRVCREARRRGLPVYVETRPLYLHLTRERFSEPDGAKYIGHPPLREHEDVEALWEGLAAGTVQTVASDHAPWSLEEKLDPALTLENHRPGVNNLQVMLPMLYSEGVRTGRISLERFVAVTATNAARLFGLHPRKGTVRVDSDADLVVWDPHETKTIRGADGLSRAGFSIYEDREVTGWPRITLRRGVVVHRDGEIEGHPGMGRLARRRRWAPLGGG